MNIKYFCSFIKTSCQKIYFDIKTYLNNKLSWEEVTGLLNDCISYENDIFKMTAYVYEEDCFLELSIWESKFHQLPDITILIPLETINSSNDIINGIKQYLDTIASHYENLIIELEEN